ncbi:hypothetical protein BC835DRAFT_1418668 [Cytidiella melzeri]|nr:hypothetical protein BC835DRAFT_1418668 [Cytidiella melzeri]
MAQVKPVMKAHQLQVNSIEEYHGVHTNKQIRPSGMFRLCAGRLQSFHTPFDILYLPLVMHFSTPLLLFTAIVTGAFHTVTASAIPKGHPFQYSPSAVDSIDINSQSQEPKPPIILRHHYHVLPSERKPPRAPERKPPRKSLPPKSGIRITITRPPEPDEYTPPSPQKTLDPGLLQP